MNCFILLLEVSTAVSFMLGLMHWFYLTTTENATLTKEGSFVFEGSKIVHLQIMEVSLETTAAH